jgi:hypothetical protein
MAAERLPWFPCYPSRLLGALAGMKPSEGYVYWVVCLRIYEVGGPCRDTIDAIARRTGLSQRWVSDALDLCFQSGRLIRHDDGIMNPFAMKILAEAKTLHERRFSSGKKGGIQSAQKRKQKQRRGPSKPSNLVQASVQQNPTHLHLHLQEQEEEKKERLSSLRSGSDWPSDYREQFWAKYPRKTGKAAAIRKLDGVRKAGKVEFSSIMAAVEKYAAASRDPQFIKHPETWINKGCWDDEPCLQPNGHDPERGVDRW